MINNIKILLLRFLYKNNVSIKYKIRVLGLLPYFKVPRNGRVVFSENVVVNSDFKNTNTALTFRCKFVTGYDGFIV